MDTTYFYGLALTPLPGLVMSPRPASERRLLTASAGRLPRDGALVIQLHRRVVAATRDEIGALRARLEAVPFRYPARPARLLRAEGL